MIIAACSSAEKTPICARANASHPLSNAPISAYSKVSFKRVVCAICGRQRARDNRADQDERQDNERENNKGHVAENPCQCPAQFNRRRIIARSGYTLDKRIINLYSGTGERLQDVPLHTNAGMVIWNWTGYGRKKLVIVESPAKARTIQRYLGSGYRVEASMGHVRDLPKSDLGVDLEANFAPAYEISPGKEKIIATLRKSIRQADAVYLATDPDREGEAIAWHITEAAKIPRSKPVYRVVFTEITPGAVRSAMASPRDIDRRLVDAQQARRVLDRLVGYKLSPLLWDKVRRGLSAGRVQSVAVRLVVEREREIEAFVPQEYWTIEADLLKQNVSDAQRDAFRAVLIERAGKKLEKFDIGAGDQAQAIIADLEGAAYVVRKVTRRDKRRSPAPPFTTSTLQQEAGRKLGFSAKTHHGSGAAVVRRRRYWRR